MWLAGENKSAVYCVCQEGEVALKLEQGFYPSLASLAHPVLDTRNKYMRQSITQVNGRAKMTITFETFESFETFVNTFPKDPSETFGEWWARAKAAWIAARRAA